MATLAAAFGSSHSIMLAATREDWLTNFRQTDKRMPFYDDAGEPCTYQDVLAKAPPNATGFFTDDLLNERFDTVQDSIKELGCRIAAARLDALIIVGDDQYELFHDEHMPSIAVYYGETIRNAARTPIAKENWYLAAQMRRLEEMHEVTYPCRADLGRHIISTLMDADFDISTLSGLAPSEHEGHAFSFIHRWYLSNNPIPIVPIFINTYNPPNQPHPRRCLQLGEQIRRAVATFDADIRVGVIASGGLSHFVVDEPMDRAIIKAFGTKDLDFLRSLDPRKLKAGSSEIRAWLVIAAAAADLELAWTSYTPAYRSPALTGTGLCFAAWQSSSREN